MNNKRLTATLSAAIIGLAILTGCGSGNTINTVTDISSDSVVTEEEVADSTYKIDQSIIDNMAAATDVSMLSLTESMKDAAVFNTGYTGRVARVMEKAGRGEAVTIAYIGGSITAGSNASPMDTNCFAALSTDWWEQTFPDASFTYVNAGIGATDSYLGAHRLKEDVLDYNPDLVVLEFAVNDGNSFNKESYEGIVRHVLLSDNEPALVTLMLTTESFSDDSNDHMLISYNYQVPIINYRGVLATGIEEGCMSWDDIGCTDGIHPKTEGHALIAYCLTKFYREVLTDINTTVYEDYTVSDNLQTKNKYEDATFVDGEEIEETSKENFDDLQKYTGLSEDNGWYTDCGGSISFTVTGDTFGIFYLKTNDGNGGQFDVFVDGENVGEINADFKNGWGNQIVYVRCGSFEEEGTHTIEVKLNENSENDDLFICGLGIA